jgi:hypothetical protein
MAGRAIRGSGVGRRADAPQRDAQRSEKNGSIHRTDSLSSLLDIKDIHARTSCQAALTGGGEMVIAALRMMKPADGARTSRMASV